MNASASAVYHGHCDVVCAEYLEGWVYDPRAPEHPVTLQVFVDGDYVADVTCDRERPDVPMPSGAEPRAGFRIDIPPNWIASDGCLIELCHADGSAITLRDPVGREISQRWSLLNHQVEKEEQLPPSSSIIVGSLDSLSEDGLTGWAYDKDAPDQTVSLEVIIDGTRRSLVNCDQDRPDVLAAGHARPNVGFHFEIPPEYYDDEEHVLDLRLSGNDRRCFHTPEGAGGVRRSFHFAARVIVGNIEGLRNGAIRGWLFSHDRRFEIKTGGMQILVTMKGQPIAQLAARIFRADVAAAHGCDPNCGFAFTPPVELVAGKTVELHFRTIPGGDEITGSPIRVSFPSFETVAAIRDLKEATDKIFTDLWLLRDRLRRLMPATTVTIENYDAWARQYQTLLAAVPSPLDTHFAEQSSLPLVSIICPVYKPRLRDFVAAVESVMSQTYSNWELIVVDDASGVESLSTQIRDFAKIDERIKPVFLKKNRGISGATNEALARASGSYVALFDHDDLLVNRALEFMIAAAIHTGAQMLYSDEDKIDDEGLFSDVNLKPDWNYRLLLSQNYICHLLLVERSSLMRVGPFRTECDGAQDHDIIIRLSEIIPSNRIFHVREILYHWRKTPTSTAASGESKSYTVSSGIRAIQDHLNRKGLNGRVKSPRGITCFDIDWNISNEPSVTIIIPYRDHIGMTRVCVEALLSRTVYENLEIVLIDNWSTSSDSIRFVQEMERDCKVKIIRLEETFNYSRLNNVAVAESSSELLLFLNNDVVVTDPSWLRIMVGEMLSDPAIGIVGNKLLYPSGLVQHGGIVLGVGGIADHIHRGQPLNDPGYCARAISAQELSAVTAACMLCRRETFEAVGGFDECDLRIAFNDVDLCLKAREAGYKIIWTPTSIAEHHESLSRGSDMRPDQQSRFFHENETMSRRWSKVLANDPYYHWAFSRESGLFCDMALLQPEDFVARLVAGRREPD